MFETFKIASRLRITYLVNGILHFLKTIPIVKNLLPEVLYDKSIIKNVITVIAMIGKILKTFLGKIAYVGICITAPLLAFNSLNADTFILVLFFFSLAGAITNTKLFNPTMDKYYAIILMKMDAKRYLISDYTFYLINFFIGMFTVMLISGIIIFGISVQAIVFAILAPLYILSIKNIYNVIRIKRFAKKRVNVSENELLKHEWILSIGFMVLPFILIYFGVKIPLIGICILAVILILTNIYTLRKIYTFEDYRYLYKELFSSEKSLVVISKKARQNVINEASKKALDMDESQTSNKFGYKYFNDLFIQRHRKILTKYSKIVTLIALAIGIMLLGACYIYPEVKTGINNMLIMLIPSVLFIMYFINPAMRVTQAMYMNCDYSMLKYNFYRSPKAILELFKERLKSLVLINLVPTLVIAIFAPILLYISGGTDNNFNYIMLVISIIAMSTFFSVHHLIMYYILQPYNKNMELKSPVYTVVSMIVYIISYTLFGKEIPVILFGSIITIFCLIYIIIGTILAYRLAPKTFKVK